MKGACGIVESKASLRWEIIEGLTHIAGCWKWGDHRSLMEIGYELTRLTLDGVSMTDELPGQEAYGAFGQGFKTALASTFERLRGVFPEDCGGVSNWKDRIDTAGEIARDALGVVRHLAMTLDLVDSVNPANRLIVEEAIGRGMVVWWMGLGGECASESAVFSVFGRSGAYVADERGISYSEAACNEVAELIFDSKKPADLRPVGKIEFDCSEARREISRRESGRTTTERSSEMAKNNLQIEVNETTENDKRTITITITGAADDFLLADLLAQRKAIPPGAIALKSAALEGVKSWLESAEQVITGPRNEEKIAEETPPKRDRKPKTARSPEDVPKTASAPEDVPSRRVKPETVNGAIAATSVSGS